MAVENLITQHLGIWTSAIKTKSAAGRGSSKKLELVGIKKLRELILELAVRGKLVPQDPNDEPASVLLEKIAEEKTQLLKGKLIKKPKKLADIAKQEMSTTLPQGWEFVRLNDLGEWGAGATPRRGNSELYGGDIPWFKSGELSADYIELSVETVTELALKQASLRYNKVGDVLLAMYGATIGKTSILKVRATTNQAVCACTPFTGFSNIFLLTLLKAYRPKFIGMGTGGAQPNISREKIIATVISLPPLAEQHRIVAKVDDLMALCDQLEAQTEASIDAHKTLVEVLLATLTDAKNADELNDNWQTISQHFDVLFTTQASIDQLKQTILQLAVMGKLVKQDPSDEPACKLLERIATEKQQLIKNGKIKKQKPLPPITEEEKHFVIPDGWDWVKLDYLAKISEAGWSPQCNGHPRVKSNWGVLKVSAVSWGKYNPDENKELPDSLVPRPEYEVKSGDFLISRANTAELVAKAVVVPPDTPAKLMMSDKIIRFNFSSFVNLDYIQLVNNSSQARSYYGAVAGGTSSSMKNVSREQIRNLVFALPSSNEQHRIVTKVGELMVLCDSLKAGLTQTQTTQLHLTVAMTEQSLGQLFNAKGKPLNGN
jgi:type I restriction enzyme S subunit